VRYKPYDFTPISPGIALGYRRNQGTGVWVVRVADGRGSNWTKRVGLADDYEAGDGEHVLTWWEAIDRARQLARGQDDDAVRPATIAEAINAYERDLIARGGIRTNATRIRKHLAPTLAAKPVALVTARELAHWRDHLLAEGMKPPSAARLCKSLKAALNLAGRRDHRIANQAAWRDGLGGISEQFVSRNVQRLDDDQVGAVVAAGYAVDRAFGLYLETLAQTGARNSQLARLTVADLQADNGTPRLMMPCSRKGKNRKAEKRPVPITPALAAKLKSNRPAEAPLLLRPDGRAWQSSSDRDHVLLYQQAAMRAGIKGTSYALRHSSIVRALLKNVPTRVVAAVHDTSVQMIERTYASHIADFADGLARSALVDFPEPLPRAKVVRLKRRN
jgi:integrase